MSINCSNFCLYQIDGCCNLKTHNKKTNIVNKIVKTDCPYFEKYDKL